MEHVECTNIRCKNPDRFKFKAITRHDYHSADFLCHPHEHFKIDCNYCTCWRDGKTLLCTKANCLSDNLDAPIPVEKLKYEIERDERRRKHPNFYDYWSQNF